ARGLKPAALGLTCGAAASLLTAIAFRRVLSRFHLAVDPTDPVTYAAVAVILTAIITAALFVPARRAAHVDPLIALKCESRESVGRRRSTSDRRHRQRAAALGRDQPAARRARARIAKR